MFPKEIPFFSRKAGKETERIFDTFGAAGGVGGVLRGLLGAECEQQSETRGQVWFSVFLRHN